MPFNGSGVFILSATSWNPAVAGTVIDQVDWAAHVAEFNTAFSLCLTRDGQSVTTAMIPFAAGLKVSDGTVGAPAITFSSDLDNGGYRIGANNWALSAGGVKVIDMTATKVTIPVTVGAAAATNLTLEVGTGNSIVLQNTSAAQLIVASGATGGTSFPTITTTASAANAFLDSGANNNLLRSTSSIDLKKDVEDITNPEKILTLRGIWFRSLAPGDDPAKSYYSFAAEEVAAVDPRFANYGPKITGWNGLIPIYDVTRIEPDGLNTTAILAHAVDMIRAQAADLAALKTRIAVLEAKS